MINGTFFPHYSGFLRFMFSAALLALFTAVLSGCGAEQGNPLAVERLGGAPPKTESMMTIIDCRGYLNGKDIVTGAPMNSAAPFRHPIHYTGSWTPVLGSHPSKWVMVTSNTPGSTVNVVATMSRVVFDFWDYDLYPNPGTVEFFLDGNSLGSFALNRSAENGQKVLEYMVVTNKETLATVTMKLRSGACVLAGYMLVFH